MQITIARSVVVLFLAFAGCAITTDPAPDPAESAIEPAAAPATQTIQQDVRTSCLILCKQAELVCMQGCTQDPSGAQCDCVSDYLACRATC